MDWKLCFCAACIDGVREEGFLFCVRACVCLSITGVVKCCLLGSGGSEGSQGGVLGV